MTAPGRISLRAAWLVYAAVIVAATTAPFRFDADEQIILMKIAHVSANPFVDTWRGGLISAAGFILNVLFFVPFGLLGFAALRHTRSRGDAVVLVSLAGLLLSLGVETLQVFTRVRIPSSADVVANLAGAFAGAAILSPGYASGWVSRG